MEEEFYTNIYYFYYLNTVGGTETFLYQLAKKFKDYDLTIIYTNADFDQLARLKKYVKCVQFTGQTIHCKKAFFNYGVDIIDHVKAEEYTLVVHADYEQLMNKNPHFQPALHPKINHYIAVSKQAALSFKRVTGKDCDICYNPFELDKPKKVLNLISATRLSREKGKDRMIKLAEMLDKAGIPYIWTVFTTDRAAIPNPNVIYMKPQLDISGYIANADYLIQLSDSEGFCYSVVEALSLGVPVIVTECPVFKELNLENGKNCYILNFDMSNVPINDIYNKIPKNFKYEPPKDRWEDFIILEKSDYQDRLKKTYTVEALPVYQEYNITDNQLGRVPNKKEQWKVDYNRLEILLGNNKLHRQYVKIIDESK